MRNPETERPIPPHRHALGLVSDIAARILTAEPKGDYSVVSCKRAADHAMRILDACKARLDDDAALEEAKRQEQAEREEDFAYMTDHGQTVPWKRGLLDITEKRSEAEAIDPFRLWMRHKLARQSFHPALAESEHLLCPLPSGWIQPGTIPPEWSVDAPEDANYKAGEALKLQDEVEQRIGTLRQEGFQAHDVLGHKRAFKAWYQEFGIPAVRGVAAKGPKKKAKSRLTT